MTAANKIFAILVLQSVSSCFNQLRPIESTARSAITKIDTPSSGGLALAENIVNDIMLALINQKGLPRSGGAVLAQGALSLINEDQAQTALVGSRNALLLTAGSVSDTRGVERLAPLIIRGMLSAMGDAKAGIADEDMKIAVASLATAELFLSVQKNVAEMSDEIRVTLPGKIAGGAVASLGAGGLKAEKLATCVGQVMKETVNSMNASHIPKNRMGEAIASMASEGVGALGKTGADLAVMKLAAKELVSNTVSGMGKLSASGTINAAEISTMVGPVMESAVTALNTAGFSGTSQMQGIVGEMMSGAVQGLGETELATNGGGEFSASVSSCTANAISGMKGAGLNADEVTTVLGDVMRGTINALAKIVDDTEIQAMSASVASVAISSTTAMIKSEGGADGGKTMNQAASMVAGGTMAALGSVLNAADLKTATAMVTQQAVETLYAGAQDLHVAFTQEMTTSFSEGVVAGLAQSGMITSSIQAINADIGAGVKDALSSAVIVKSGVDATAFASSAMSSAQTWVDEIALHCAQKGGLWDKIKQMCTYPTASATTATGASATLQAECAQKAGLVVLSPDPAIGYFCSIADAKPPSSPAGVTLPATFIGTRQINVSWSVPSKDDNFQTHNAKLCKSSDCQTKCSVIVPKDVSPALVAVNEDGAYYACVRGVDTVGNSSPWVASTGTVEIDTAIANTIGVNSINENRTYHVGETILIDVSFTKSVVVTGTGLGLWLETGATDRLATYYAGSGSQTITFQYIVQLGDASTDLDIVNSAALTIGSGSLKSINGLAANTTLTAPASSGSLSANKNLVIDTVVVPISSAPTNPSVAINGGADLTGFSSVNLTLAATGASEMLITENPDCTTGGSWQGYSPSIYWYFSSGTEGIKTVYAIFRNETGNTSTCVSSSIQYYYIEQNCSGQTTPSSCTGALCIWQGTSCVNRAICSYRTTSTDCTTQSACSWSAATSSCVPAATTATFASVTQIAGKTIPYRRGDNVVADDGVYDNITSTSFGNQALVAYGTTYGTKLTRWNDASASWSTPVAVVNDGNRWQPSGSLRLARSLDAGTEIIHIFSGATYARSLDGGISWDFQTLVASSNSQYASSDTIALAADDTGHVAALVRVESHDTNGSSSTTQLRLLRSSNHGVSWTSSIVNPHNYADWGYPSGQMILSGSDIYVCIGQWDSNPNTQNSAANFKWTLIRYPDYGASTPVFGDIPIAETGNYGSISMKIVGGELPQLELSMGSIYRAFQLTTSSSTLTVATPSVQGAITGLYGYSHSDVIVSGSNRILLFTSSNEGDGQNHLYRAYSTTGGAAFSSQIVADLLGSSNLTLVKTLDHTLVVYLDLAGTHLLSARATDNTYASWSATSGAYNVENVVADNFATYNGSPAIVNDGTYLFALHGSGSGQRLSRSADGGQSWQVATIPYLSERSSGQLVITTDANSPTGKRLNVLSGNTTGRGLLLARSLDRGNHWSYATAMSGSPSNSYYVTNLTSSGNTMHLCYGMNQWPNGGGSSSSQIWYGSSSDGVTFNSRMLNSYSTQEVSECAIGSTGSYVYLAYRASSGDQPIILRSSDTGSNFATISSAESTLQTSYGWGNGFKIATNSRYAYLLIGNDIYRAAHTGLFGQKSLYNRSSNSWEWRPQHMSLNVSTSNPTTGDLVLTYLSNPHHLYIVRSADDGDSWSAPSPLDSSDANREKWTALTALGSMGLVAYDSNFPYMAQNVGIGLKSVSVALNCSSAGSNSTSCLAIPGCSMTTSNLCDNKPFGCDLYTSASACASVGCSWINEACMVEPTRCQSISSETTCSSNGCVWSNQLCTVPADTSVFTLQSTSSPSSVAVARGTQILASDELDSTVAAATDGTNGFAAIVTKQGVMFTKTTTGNTDWSSWTAPVEILYQGASIAQRPVALAAGGDAGGVAGWHYLHLIAGSLYLRSSDGGATWTNGSDFVTDALRFYNDNDRATDIAADASGNVAVLYTQATDTSHNYPKTMLTHSIDNGLTWTTISTDSLEIYRGSNGMNVSLAINNGSIYLVYANQQYSYRYQIAKETVGVLGVTSINSNAYYSDTTNNRSYSYPYDARPIARSSSDGLELLIGPNLLKPANADSLSYIPHNTRSDYGYSYWVGSNFIAGDASFPYGGVAARLIVTYQSMDRQLLALTSSDGGITWSPTSVIADVADGRRFGLINAGKKVAVLYTGAGSEGLYLLLSNDGGHSWSGETAATYTIAGTVVDKNVNTYYNYYGNRIAMGGQTIGTPNSDYVYVVHQSNYNETRFSRSTDSGTSWKAATIDGLTHGSLAMTVAPDTNGTIYVFSDPSGNDYWHDSATDTYYGGRRILAKSVDHGTHWSYTPLDATFPGNSGIGLEQSQVGVAASADGTETKAYVCYTDAEVQTIGDSTTTKTGIRVTRLTNGGADSSLNIDSALYSSTTSNTNFTRCAIAVYGTSVYVVFNDSNSSTLHIFALTDSGTQFTEKSSLTDLPLSSTDNWDYYKQTPPQIAISSSGLYVLTGAKFYYSDLTAVSFTGPIMIHGQDISRSTLTLSGSTLVASFQISPNRLYATRSFDGGSSWTAPALVDAGDAESGTLAMAGVGGSVYIGYPSFARFDGIGLKVLKLNTGTAGSCSGLISDADCNTTFGCSYATDHCEKRAFSCSYIGTICYVNKFTVSGYVSGLYTGESVSLKNNAADELSKTGDGSFAFATRVSDGNPYAVTVTAAPDHKSCSVTNGSGTIIGENITTVAVTCSPLMYSVGVDVSGLAGETLVLQNNGGDNLSVTSDGAHLFNANIPYGGGYYVSVLTQPDHRICSVSAPGGTNSGANITNISVTCADLESYFPAASWGLSGATPPTSTSNVILVTTPTEWLNLARGCSSNNTTCDAWVVLLNDIDFASLDGTTGDATSGDGKYTTTSDLDMLGSYEHRFTGKIAGRGHKITNLNFSLPTNSNVGLISASSHGCMVKDLGFEGDVAGLNNVGGLFGNGNYCALESSYHSGSVSGSGSLVGGLMGSADNASLGRSHNAGTVAGTVAGSADGLTGGLIGGSSSTSIEYSYNTAAVSGLSAVGGLFGGGSANISLSYNAGSVTALSSDVGGIAGRVNNGSIINSYNIGNVQENGTVSDISGIGGILGSTGDQNSTTSITNCYSTGEIKAMSGASQGGIGGILGVASGTAGTHQHNYFLKGSVDSDRNNALGAEETDADAILAVDPSMASFASNVATLKQQETFVGWDFTTETAVWSISQSSSYPYLKNLVPSPLPGAGP